MSNRSRKLGRPTSPLKLEELERRETPAASPIQSVITPIDPTQEFSQTQIIVGFKNANKVLPGATSLGLGMFSIPVVGGMTVAQTLNAYASNPEVAFAEVDYLTQIARSPNDPFYRSGTLWGMNNTGQSGGVNDADIDGPEAWDFATGVGVPASTPGYIVGVIDTGVDYNHEDLAANMWRNTGEVAGDRIDNDGNGYVDDVFGYDFVNNDSDPMDDNRHGTHCAGTIGGVGNNSTGVAGVMWKAQIMALKIFDATGRGAPTSGIVRAVNYATMMGAKVTNNSWGGGGYSQSLFNAIANARANDALFIAAAGNSGANNDINLAYPSGYNLDNIIAVAATDRRDQLAGFSQYGATTVDLGAPGVSILSTTPGNTYSFLDGTSMATPHVAGAAGLLRFFKGATWDYNMIRDQILGTVDLIPSLTGRTATGGRLNIFRALTENINETVGPRVESVTFHGPQPTVLNVARVKFTEKIQLLSFTKDDVVITGPNGQRILVSSITPVAGSNQSVFDIAFTAQTTAGTYSFKVGPNITDNRLNLMDQNNNGINGETADFYLAQATLAASGSFSNTNPVSIRDNSTVTSSINVTSEMTIADVDVRVSIVHSRVSDLVLTLISPNGTRILLSNRRGGNGSNYSFTMFDDAAAAPIATGAAPFNGSFRPDNPLGKLNGMSAKGTWRIEVKDSASGAIGTLQSWSLMMRGSGHSFTPAPAGTSSSSVASSSTSTLTTAPAVVSGPSSNSLASVQGNELNASTAKASTPTTTFVPLSSTTAMNLGAYVGGTTPTTEGVKVAALPTITTGNRSSTGQLGEDNFSLYSVPLN
jgi:serine protease